MKPYNKNSCVKRKFSSQNSLRTERKLEKTVTYVKRNSYHFSNSVLACFSGLNILFISLNIFFGIMIYYTNVNCFIFLIYAFKKIICLELQNSDLFLKTLIYSIKNPRLIQKNRLFPRFIIIIILILQMFTVLLLKFTQDNEGNFYLY